MSKRSQIQGVVVLALLITGTVIWDSFIQDGRALFRSLDTSAGKER